MKGNKTGMVDCNVECQDKTGLCLKGHGEPLKVYKQSGVLMK
jgi:hypothetical protein